VTSLAKAAEDHCYPEYRAVVALGQVKRSGGILTKTTRQRLLPQRIGSVRNSLKAVVTNGKVGTSPSKVVAVEVEVDSLLAVAVDSILTIQEEAHPVVVCKVVDSVVEVLVLVVAV
jgi:hypothetical protein